MPRGLYIHIPFCLKKCKYCDFISFTNKENQFDKYLEALKREAQEYNGEEINTVFIGGGTPTILSCEQLSFLFEIINTNFEISKNSEFTIEANPKTVDKEKLSVLKKGGVNRISIGVQSFCDNELKSIGRVHKSKEAIKTAELIKAFGGFDLNIDLMLSLPHQTEESLLKTLYKTVNLNPSHISCYSLILEEGTPLHNEYQNNKFELLDDEDDRKLYHMAVDYLKNYGYSRYEISNFAKANKECKHNLKYWSCDEYIGLGIAAHSYVNSERFYNASELDKYLRGEFHSKERITLSQQDKMSEYIIMRLRLRDGIDENEFSRRFNSSFYSLYGDKIEKLIDAGLMQKNGNKYFLTDYGFDLSNTAMCEFV